MKRSLVFILILLLIPFAADAQTIKLPKTGQTIVYGSGDDGALQKGVSWPSPRFSDNHDGTINDNLTGLVWLKNANCFGSKNWADAHASANGLKSGACGLTDGSSAGDWRLPNRKELRSLINYSKEYNYEWLNSLSSASGFIDVRGTKYWSSTTYAKYAQIAWVVSMWDGSVGYDDKADTNYLWPVRSDHFWPLDTLLISSAVVPDFGTRNLKSKPVVREVTLRNTGSDDETLSSLAITGGDTAVFGIVSGGSSPCATLAPTIAPGSSCTLLISFSPDTTGAKSANLTINANDKSMNIPLAGSVVTTINGVVSDLTTGRPMAGVTVSLPNGMQTQTDTKGTFFFNPPPALGSYHVTFTKSGYGTVTSDGVLLSDTGGVELNIGLTATGPLNITSTSPLLHAETGNLYSQQVNISGGTHPYAFGKVYGTLPPGLDLDAATGIISGTPGTAGSYTSAISVTDAQGAYAEREFTVEVTQPLVVQTPSVLPRATKGITYAETLQVTGGTMPYSFANLLPSIYKLNKQLVNWQSAKSSCENAGGYLTAINSSAENSTVVTLAQQGGNNTWIGLNDIESEGTFKWSSNQAVTYTNWDTGQPNNQSDGYEGDCGELLYGASYRWNDSYCNRTRYYICEADRLPPGINIDINGNLTGVPAIAGTYEFAIKITDASGRTLNKDFMMHVDAPLTHTTTRLIDGVVGSPFSQTLAATGGHGAYTWELYSGSLPTGLTLGSTTGMITGTPTTATSRQVVLSVQDAYGRVVFRHYDINVLNPMQILTTSLPNGLVSNNYSEQARVSGGLAPFSFTISGQLPAGLQMNGATGVVSGIPTATGLTNLELTVTDSTYPTPQRATRSLSIRVTSSVTITSSAVLPNAKVGTAINPIALVAKGGTPGYTWSVVGGYLPDGLVLDPATGVISGAPADRGDFSFQIRVTDSAGNGTGPDKAPPNPDKQFILHVSDTLVITTAALPNGAKGVAFSAILSATGGVKSYRWAVTNGTLPAGLTLNAATGTISGTPTLKTSSSVTFEVTDSDVPTQKAQKTIAFNISDSLAIYEASLPDSRLNVAYAANIRAQLGTPPYSWRLAGGILPPGLHLTENASIASIQGTATTAGTYSFTLEASDKSTPVQMVSRNYSITVYPELAITTPGLLTAVRSTPYIDVVGATGGVPPYTYAIVSGNLPQGLILNSATGYIIGSVTMDTGQSATFTVRATDDGYPPTSVEKQYTLFAVDPLTIDTRNIQEALQKSFYTVTFTGQGGVSPLTWSVVHGALPQGLMLNEQTGILSGATAVCGTFSFTLQLADSATVTMKTQKEYQLVVVCSNDYELSGKAEAAGATVTITGSAQRITVADAGGNYLFRHLTNGSYTITPTKSGYWFEPESKTITISNSDMAGVAFVARADSTPPTCSVTIKDGAAFTRTTSAVLGLSASDIGSGVVLQMQFSSDNVTWSVWEEYAATKNYTIPPGDGVKTIYTRFKDKAGNVSDVCSTTITLDTTAPLLTINQVPPSVGSTTNTLTGNTEPGATVTVATDTAASDGPATVVGTTWNYAVTGLTIGVNNITVTARDAAGNIAVETASITRNPSVAVIIAGSGHGTVVSTPPGIACNTACSALFTPGLPVALKSTPHEFSLFAGWSGACTGSGDCNLTMDTDQAVTATFNRHTANAVRIDRGTPYYFPTIIAAYTAAVAGNTIKAWGTDFTGDLILDHDKSVLLKGGYNSAYTNNAGKTILKGRVFLRKGRVNFENTFIR